MRPRPVLHETEAETKTNYCETETKKWSRDHAGIVTLTSLSVMGSSIGEPTKHEQLVHLLFSLLCYSYKYGDDSLCLLLFLLLLVNCFKSNN